jgi:hypothetical protein
MFSLRIPHIATNTNPEYIIETFKMLDIANVSDVVFVSKLTVYTTSPVEDVDDTNTTNQVKLEDKEPLTGGEYNNFPGVNAEADADTDTDTNQPVEMGEAFIRINYWYDNAAVDALKERILDEVQEARLVYDDPNYWLIEACDDEDIDKLFSEIKLSISKTEDKLKQMSDWIAYNYHNISYLMDASKKEWQRSQRQAKRQANYKARNGWLRRLRPRTHPYTYNKRKSRGTLWAP